MNLNRLAAQWEPRQFHYRAKKQRDVRRSLENEDKFLNEPGSEVLVGGWSSWSRRMIRVKRELDALQDAA